jgi:hypothetical protein
MAVQRVVELPKFPRVLVKGTEIFIIDERGQERFWGNEVDMKSAFKIAEEVQKELRAMRYVKNKLSETLSEIGEELVDFGISLNRIDNIIYEGCFEIQKILMQLDANP